MTLLQIVAECASEKKLKICQKK